MSPLRMLGVHRGVAVLLALLTLSAAALVAGLPRMVEGSYDRAARQAVRENPAEITDLAVTLVPGWEKDLLPGADRIAERYDRLRAELPAPLRPLVAGGEEAGGTYAVRTYRQPLADRIGEPRQVLQFLNLAWIAGADRRVRYVEGSPPGPAQATRKVPGHAELGEVPFFEIALSRAGAEELRLKVGSLLLLGDTEPRLARVTGLFEPVRAADPFWRHHQEALRVVIRRGNAEEDERHLTGLIDAGAVPRLRGYNGDLHYLWTLPVDPGAITARDAAAVAEAIGHYRYVLGEQTVSPEGGARFELRTLLDTALTRYLDRQRTAVALMWLVLGGLVAVACGVVALGVRLLGDRMRPSLTLARARGASLAQIAAIAGGAAALVCVPAALAGYGLAFLVPGPAVPVVHLGPALIALAAVALAAASAAITHRVPLRERREDVAARRPSPRRLVAELLVVVLAVVGAYLLRTRGLASAAGAAASGPGGTAGAAAGTDPFLVLVPAALALAAALVTVRLYPYPLRLLARIAARRRPAVPFLGLTMAARGGAVTTLPVLVLLPALAVSVYGVAVAGELDAAQTVAAWRATGAAARIEQQRQGPPGPVVARLREVPGVRDVLPALKGTAQLDAIGRTATVIAVDLDAYRRLLAGSPLTAPAPPADTAAPALPALVSPDLTVFTRFDAGWYRRVQVVPAGVIDGGLPGLAPEQGSLIVVPYGALNRAGLADMANVLLVDGDDPDPARLREAAGGEGVSVVTVRGEFDRLAGAPLTAAIRAVLQVVIAALACYAALAVVIALAAGADRRATTLSYLRALGLSEGQARNVTVLEVAPVVACTAVAGLLLGLALPALLGPGIDISVYAGAPGVRGLPPGIGTPVLLAAGLTAVAVLGGFAHAAAGRRRSLGSVLRVGDTS